MIDLFSTLKGFIKLKPISYDNGVFKLHYKATCTVLLVCSLLVTAKQYIGDPIDCVVEEIPGKVMDTYCWIHSTFSVPHEYPGIEGVNMAHPGVAEMPPDGEEEIRYHKYYQWVCFTLFFQALCFYVPHYIWKLWEGGRLKLLVNEMDVPIVSKDVKEKKIDLIIKHFKSTTRTSYNFYAFRFFFCEFLNLINVIGQIFFVDFFLGGEFSQYGSQVFSHTQADLLFRLDPMDRVFPKVTKCTFHKFGPSGTIENFDGLCVLPLNIINEKIYIFLWLWFIVISIISGFQFLFRLMTLFIPGVRSLRIRTRCTLVSPDEANIIVEKCSIGEWFLICQLAKNMDTLVFRDFMHALCDVLSRGTDEEDDSLLRDNDSIDEVDDDEKQKMQGP